MGLYKDQQVTGDTNSGMYRRKNKPEMTRDTNDSIYGRDNKSANFFGNQRESKVPPLHSSSVPRKTIVSPVRPPMKQERSPAMQRLV